MALRAVLGFCAMSCFFTAAKGLALADLSILAKLQPLIIAIVAPLLLGRGERSGPIIWVILAVGLVGSGLLIGPELAIGGTYGLWALGAAFFSALAHTMIRALGKTDNAPAIVFWFQATTLVLAVPAYGLLEGALLPLPPSHLWPYLVGTGLAATAGQVLMTNAYRMEKASVIAAASYAGPLWAASLDLVVFGVVPSGWALAGGALVVGAGLTLVLTTRQASASAPSEVPAAAE
jgi:drug/metabolite transporter (DMT)-like permease